MRVLVTGHDGYIGAVLVPVLQAAGHEHGCVAACGPVGCGHARQPDGVELQPAGLQGAEQVHLRQLGFGLEYGVGRHALELVERRLQRHPRADEIHAREVIEQVAPAVQQLEVGAGQRRRSRPPGGLEDVVDADGPFGRRGVRRQLPPQLGQPGDAL